MSERLHDGFKKLSLWELQLFRVDKDELVFEKLGGEHNFETHEPLLVVDWVLEGARYGTVCFTTTGSLRGTPVTLT